MAELKTTPEHQQLYRLDTSTLPPESSASHRGVLIPTLPTFSFSQASGARSSTASRRRSNLGSRYHRARHGPDITSWNDSSEFIAHETQLGSSGLTNSNYIISGRQGGSSGSRANSSRVHPATNVHRLGQTNVSKGDTTETVDGKSKGLDSKWDEALRRIKIRTLTFTLARVPASASSRNHFSLPEFPSALPPCNVPEFNPYVTPNSASLSSPIVQEYNNSKETLAQYDGTLSNEEKNIRFVIPSTSTCPTQTRHVKISEYTASRFLRNLLRQEISGDKPVSLFIGGERFPFHVKTFFPLVQEGGEYLLEFAQLSWAEEQVLDLQGIGRMVLNARCLQQKHKVA